MSTQRWHLKIVGPLALVVVVLVVVMSTLRVQKRETSAASTAAIEGSTMNNAGGFYCNAKALNKTERDRYNQLTAEVARARLEIRELPDGYAFRVQQETVAIADLAEWISFERKCCPFFSFEIELERDNGPLWLKLKGREGVKPFIRSEFNLP